MVGGLTKQPIRPSEDRPVWLIRRRLVIGLTCCGLWTGGIARAADVAPEPTPPASSQPSFADQPPKIDVQHFEPTLAARITDARAAVLAQPESAAAWGRLGTVCAVHGLPDPARICLDRAAALDPADLRWPYLAGRLVPSTARATAIGHLRRAVKLAPEYVPARLQLAGLLSGSDEPAQAMAHLQEAMRQGGTDWRVCVAAAETAMLLGDLELALRYLDRALELGPDQAGVHLSRARLHALLNDEPAAQQAAQRARSLPPSGPMADPVLDAAWAERALARDYLARGRQRYQDGRLAEAIAEWRELLRLAPESAAAPAAHAMLGRALQRQGLAAEAIEHYLVALDIAPDNVELLVRTGDLLIEQNRVDDALALYERAVQLRPNVFEVANGYARCLQRAGRLEDAERQARRATGLVPDRAEGWVLLARIQLDAGDSEGCLETCRQGLQRDERTAGLHLVRGDALDAAGRSDEAMEAWRRAMALAPDDVVVLTTLAWAQLTHHTPQEGDSPAALSLAERAVELAPEYPVALNALAMAQVRAGRAAEGLETASRAALIQPDDPVNLLIQGSAHAQLGNWTQARNLITKAREMLDADPQADPAWQRLLDGADETQD